MISLKLLYIEVVNKMSFEYGSNHIILACAVTLLCYVYLHLTRNFNFWKNQHVPYLQPTFLFGNLLPVLTMKISMSDFLRSIYNLKKAPFVGFFCYDQPFLLIRDPELIKHVLVKDFENFSDRTLYENKLHDKFGSSVLFSLKNPAWRQARTKLTPVFTSGKIKNMTYLIVDVSKTLTQYIESQILNSEEICARELSMKYSTDVITSCAFGIVANSFQNENAEFRKASRKLFESTFLRIIQMSSYFFGPILVKLFRMKFLEPESCDFLRKALEDTINQREKTKAYRGDLVDLLIELKNSDAKSTELLDYDILISQGIQFFAAGFETTGSTISFTLHELSFNQSIQKRLRSEILSVIEKQGGITYDAVQSMPYMDMIISETLRKYPALAFLDRRTTKDFKIPNSDVLIKKGLPIYISLLGLHYDPEYFPDPQRYDPERFNPQCAKNDNSSFVYMPFGQGLHNCIGSRFALISVKVALAAMLSKVEVHPCEDTPYEIKFNPKATLLAPQNDIKMYFKNFVDGNKDNELIN